MNCLAPKFVKTGTKTLASDEKPQYQLLSQHLPTPKDIQYLLHVKPSKKEVKFVSSPHRPPLPRCIYALYNRTSGFDPVNFSGKAGGGHLVVNEDVRVDDQLVVFEMAHPLRIAALKQWQDQHVVLEM